MKHLAIVLLLILSAAVAGATVKAQAQPPCYSAALDSVDVYTAPSRDMFYPLRRDVRSLELRQAILNLHGRNIWVGYERGGFDPMPSGHVLLLIVWFTRGGERYSNYVWFAESDGHPAYRYVFVYPSMDEYTDAQGRHRGPHPTCGKTWEISAEDYDQLLRLAGVS